MRQLRQALTMSAWSSEKLEGGRVTTGCSSGAQGGKARTYLHARGAGGARDRALSGSGPLLAIDLSPPMRFYFRWGQRCALFRILRIIAVERRRHDLLDMITCSWSWMFCCSRNVAQVSCHGAHINS